MEKSDVESAAREVVLVFLYPRSPPINLPRLILLPGEGSFCVS